MHRRFNSVCCSSWSSSGLSSLKLLALKDDEGGGRLLLVVEVEGDGAPEFTGGQ